ncbi:MAG: hypothetical protein HOV68_04495, partial [Streptomycetaceae bacterium]|nr:hypothetical protein [Streptomycetaceae bacterium]
MIDHNDRVRYAEIFERYDDNNDGLLNAKELIRALDALGRTSEGSSAEQLMR